jgi:hypothetical protein
MGWILINSVLLKVRNRLQSPVSFLRIRNNNIRQMYGVLSLQFVIREKHGPVNSLNAGKENWKEILTDIIPCPTGGLCSHQILKCLRSAHTSTDKYSSTLWHLNSTRLLPLAVRLLAFLHSYGLILSCFDAWKRIVGYILLGVRIQLHEITSERCEMKSKLYLCMKQRIHRTIN